MPYQASGYLILDAQNNPTVVDWNIQLQTQSSDATGQLVYTTVRRIQVSDSYFTKIDEEFNNGDYFISVVGTDALRNIVVNEGPVPICPGCPTDGESCWAACVGPDYAWKGFAYNPVGGTNVTLTITTAHDPLTGQPFYQYFSPAQYFSLPNDANLWNYYGVSSWSVFGQGNKIIQLTGVDASDGLKDISNNTLTGTVYGIQKSYGPWANNGVIQAQNLSITLPVLCLPEQGLTTMVSIINNNSFSSWLDPDLECAGYTISVPGESGSDAIEFFVDCADLVEAWLGAGNSLVEAFELFDCLAASQPGFNWPSEVAVINIAPYTNPNQEGWSFTEADLFNPNGEFESPAIDLERGLYQIGIQFNDASYHTLFFESHQNTTHTYALSNFLEAGAFPVPIIDDEFTLNLHAYAKLKFDYVLYDLNGVELYRKNFVLQEGHDRSHVIKVNSGIPDGQLVNKFIFEDGSELQFQTMK